MSLEASLITGIALSILTVLATWGIELIFVASLITAKTDTGIIESAPSNTSIIIFFNILIFNLIKKLKVLKLLQIECQLRL